MAESLSSDQAIRVVNNIVIDVDKKNSEKYSKPITSASILTNLHASYFRISLSLGCQALLWKTLNNQKHSSHILEKFPTITFLLLWYLSFIVLILLSILYLLRCIFYFNMVKAEFLHFVGVNYMYTPWTSWLIVLQSAPILTPDDPIYRVLGLFFVIPLLVLDVKIYGQWFTTEKKFLSMVANPTSQISVIGNLVAAWTAAQMGWKECATCIFTLGITHYLVLFVTLYQRLSNGHHLPVTLRPVYFLFVAAPSMASLAWSSISGSFDTPCRMLYFLSLFLFTSLICRPSLFKKAMKKYSIAWWAYSFPLSFLAMASVEYADQVRTAVASGLMLVIAIVSVAIFVGLILSTALNMDILLRPTDPIFRFNDTNKITGK